MSLTDSFRNLGNQGRFWNELSMTILSIPRDYTLCTNSECEKSMQCLRYLSFLEISQDNITIKVLNPKLFPAANHDCKFFNSTNKINLAWGIKNILNDLPYQIAKEVKKDLLARFGHTKYYRFYREEVALMPKDQEIFQNIFEKHGIAEKPAYTRFTEEYNWESTVSK